MSSSRPRGRWAPLVAAALLALCATLPAQAQWVWRDAAGRITASDMPPPRDTPEHDILRRPRPQGPATAAAADAPAPQPVASAPAKDALRDTRRPAAPAPASAPAAQTAAAEAAASAERRAENCRRAQTHLKLLQTGTRLVTLNEKGERVVMDDRARAEEIRRAREVMASECR